MSPHNTERRKRFDVRSEMALIVAGIALAGVAIYKAVFFLTPIEVSIVIDTGYGGFALVVTGFALLGLYQRVRDAAPKTATAAAMFSVLSICFVIVVWVWLVGTTIHLGRLPVIPEEAPIWTVLALLGNFISLSTGFILMAIASHRTDAIPRMASGLLVVPALMWLGLIANVAVNLIPNISILVYVVNAIAVGGIGYLIREGETTGRVHATDPSAGQGKAP